MAAAPFHLDGEEPLHPAEERAAFARGALEGALERDTPQERYGALLSVYLFADALERDAILVEAAWHLCWGEASVSRRSAGDPECSRVDATRTRLAPRLWDRLRAALGALRARPLQPRSGS